MLITMLTSIGDEAVESAVRDELRSNGVELRIHDLTHERFAPCQGCFECWIAHPGTCKASDSANDVMRDLIASDAALWLVAPRFGAWDPVAKAALDKVIGLISPFFTTVAGETHHHRRYERYPNWAVLALSGPGQTDGEREMFRTLVERNMVNLHVRSPFVAFADAADPVRFRTMARDALAHVTAEHPDDDWTMVEPLPPVEGAEGPDVGNRRAVLWVGSAKPHRNSTSEALGTALIRRLESRGWDCRTVHAAAVTKLGRDGSSELVEAARSASLLIVASPVYVDCLPALVLKGLGDLVDAAAGRSDGPALLPIIQCGFPEATHTRLAVEVLARAASSAGWAWAGHVALGGGGAIDGADIDASGRFHGLQAAFDQIADALDAGDPVPPDLTSELSVPLVNPTLYRWVGDVGWLTQSVRHRALTRLWQRPFASSVASPPGAAAGSGTGAR